MERRIFKVGELVCFTEDMGGLSRGTIATINSNGGRAPIDMTRRGDWNYTVTLPNGGNYSAQHKGLAYATRKTRINALTEYLEELKGLITEASNDLLKVEKYQDDADYLASKIIDIIIPDAKKHGFLPSKIHIQKIREEILKMYPSKYKYTE